VDKRLSVDDILADVQRLRDKQDRQQAQPRMQNADHANLRKLRIGSTSEMPRLVSKEPISAKGKLFHTQQLQQMNEEARQRLSERGTAVDVSAAMQTRDVRRRQVIDEMTSRYLDAAASQKPAPAKAAAPAPAPVKKPEPVQVPAPAPKAAEPSPEENFAFFTEPEPAPQVTADTIVAPDPAPAAPEEPESPDRVRNFVLDPDAIRFTTEMENDSFRDLSAAAAQSAPPAAHNLNYEAAPEIAPEAELAQFGEEDPAAVRAQIGKDHLGNLITTCLLGALTVFMIYLDFAQRFLSLPLLKVMDSALSPTGYLLTNIAALLIAMLLAAGTIGGGLRGLFTFKADSNALPAFASLTCLVQSIFLLLSPSALKAENVHLYTSVALIALLMNKAGKCMMTRRMILGMKPAFSSRPKRCVGHISDDALSFEMIRGTTAGEAIVAASAPVDRFTNFVERSSDEDISDRINTILAPIVALAGILLSVACGLLYGDAASALTVLTAVTTLCTPIAAMLTANLPLLLLSRNLAQRGGFLCGYSTLASLADTQAVAVDAGDLFPRGSIVLHNLKTFPGARIDDALLDTASIICRLGGTLKDVFAQIVGSTDMLSEVDSIVYEDGMGVSAWIRSKRVLIGNANLLKLHNIQPLPAEQEKRLCRDGRQLVYLAVSGVPVAIFVVSYTADPAIKKAVRRYVSGGGVLVVRTTDANITEELLTALFDLPVNSVRILSTKQFADYETEIAPMRTVQADAGYLAEDPMTAVSMISGCRHARNPITLSAVLQTAGAVLAYAIVAFLAFMQGIGQLGIFIALGYQVFWLLLCSVILLLGRYK